MVFLQGSWVLCRERVAILSHVPEQGSPTTSRGCNFLPHLEDFRLGYHMIALLHSEKFNSPPVIFPRNGKPIAAVIEWNLHSQIKYQYWECRLLSDHHNRCNIFHYRFEKSRHVLPNSLSDSGPLNYLLMSRPMSDIISFTRPDLDVWEAILVQAPVDIFHIEILWSQY